MFASSLAQRPDDEDDIGSPSAADIITPAAEAPIIDDVPPPPTTGTTVSDEALDAAIENSGPPVVGPASEPLPPPLPTQPLPDMTPTPAAAPTPGMKFSGTTPELQAAAADQRNATDAGVKAAENAALVHQQAIKEQADAQAKITQDKAAHAERVQAEIKAHNERIEAALAKKQQYFDEARAMPYHDLWADRTTGDRVLGAVAVFLGGLGGGENQAMKILDQRMKYAYDKQAHDIDGKWKLYAEQSKNVEDAEKGKANALSDLNLVQSARYEAAADHLVELKTRQGIPADAAQKDKDVVDIRQKAADIRMKEAKDEADRQERYTRDLLRQKAKGAGGGGSDKAMEAFVAGVNALKPGQDIPPELYTLGRHAGYKPNQVGSEIDRIRNSGNKESKGANGSGTGGAGEDKEVNKRMDAYQKEAIGNAKSQGPVRVLSQVEAMRQGLEDAVKSGDSDKIKAAAIKAKEQAGTLMSGGKLTNAQITILKELESTTDHMVSTIGKFTGSPTEGAGAVKRLTQVIEDAGTETLAQIGDIRQRGINEHLRPGGLAKTEESKRTFMNRNTGLYSEVRWKGKPIFDEGKGGATSIPGSAGVKSTGDPSGAVTVPADAAERTAKAQRALSALNNPSLTPAQKAKARDYLISIGAR